MSAVVTPAAKPTVCFAAVDFLDADERGLASEIWLDDLCRSPWASKEAMMIGAFISRLAAEASTAPLHLKDIESRYNIQLGEITMSLNMLQTFRTVDSYDSDRGQIVVRLRLGLAQMVRVRELHARFVAMKAGASGTGALAAIAGTMRRVNAEAAA